jgi:hypothetical protein
MAFLTTAKVVMAYFQLTLLFFHEYPPRILCVCAGFYWPRGKKKRKMGEGGEWAGKEERHALGPSSFLNLERVFSFL